MRTIVRSLIKESIEELKDLQKTFCSAYTNAYIPKGISDLGIHSNYQMY